MTGLQDCLLNLSALTTQIEYALKSISKDRRAEDEDLMFTVCNHILILICSFLEEWKVLVGFGKGPRIQLAVRAARPAIERIEMWGGLHKIRSILLAHNLRTKDGKSIRPWDAFKEHDAPTNHAEVMLLAKLAIMATRTVVASSRPELEEAQLKIALMERDIPRKGIRTKGEIETELRRVENEIRDFLTEPTRIPIASDLEK